MLNSPHPHFTWVEVVSKAPRVALDVETSLVYGRRILEGIARYLRANRPWSICLEQHELSSDPLELLKRWSGDGIITRTATADSVKAMRRRRLSIIDLGDIQPHLGILRICSADMVIGRMAAEHLLERGFEHFACCGFAGENWSQRRRDGFVTEVGHKGFTASVHESPRSGLQAWKRDQQQLVEWLDTLPKPLAIFTTNDLRGQHILDACAQLDLAVPERVAVVGVDNDEIVCGFCQPSLTSIIPNPERIGYEAAVWLDRLMQGQLPTTMEIEIPPQGIAVRQSSDVYAVSDPTVASALSFIRERACEGVTVDDVLHHVSVSRSWLERSFRKLVKHSPQAEIRDVQIRRCKELLRTTNLPLDKIAHLAGFEHPEYMSVVFKRTTNETPGNFRKRTGELNGVK